MPYLPIDYTTQSYCRSCKLILNKTYKCSQCHKPVRNKPKHINRTKRYPPSEATKQRERQRKKEYYKTEHYKQIRKQWIANNRERVNRYARNHYWKKKNN